MSELVRPRWSHGQIKSNVSDAVSKIDERKCSNPSPINRRRIYIGNKESKKGDEITIAINYILGELGRVNTNYYESCALLRIATSAKQRHYRSNGRSFVIVFVSLPESSDVVVALARDDQDSLGWVLPDAAVLVLRVISEENNLWWISSIDLYLVS